MSKRTQASHSRSRELSRYAHRWHKRIGVTASLFVIWMVISGWLLNHSDSLHLPLHQFHNATLANWYGLKYDIPKNVFISNKHWLMANDDIALLDGNIISAPKLNPVGLIEANNMLVVGGTYTVMLFSVDGKPVDTLDANALPISSIQRIGVGCNGIAIQDHADVMASEDGIEWKTCAGDVQWAEIKPVDEQQKQRAEAQLIPAISVEKLIVDMHTGRFFGRFGPYVVDAVGTCLLLLALSGVWMFSRRKNPRHK